MKTQGYYDVWEGIRKLEQNQNRLMWMVEKLVEHMKKQGLNSRIMKDAKALISEIRD